MKDESDRIDEALAAWPARETADDDWDAAAQRVVDHVDSGAQAKSKMRLGDDDLFGAPFPETPEERLKISSGTDVPISKVGAIPPPSSARPGSGRGEDQRRDGMSTQTERQRDRSSFKELAALAATPPPSSVGSMKVPVSGPISSQASGPVSGPQSAQPLSSQPAPARSNADDSGMVDLQMAAVADPQASERAKTTPLASAGLFDDEAPGSLSVASSRPMIADAVPVSERGPVSGARPLTAVAAMAAGEQGEKKKGGVVLFLGGLVVLAAAAAGGMLFLKTRAAPVEGPAAIHANTAETTAPVAATPAPRVEPAAPASTVADTPLETGKVAMAPKALIVASKRGGGGEKFAAKPGAKEPETKPEPKAAAPEKPVVGGPAGDLNAAMQKEVGPQDKATPASQPTGPAINDGTVPQKPSQGQVAGAIGAVLQNARACLGPDDPVSKALVVFGSSGAVSSVTVTGHAAGTPAEACIKTAFGKAKVGPFAETSYSANVTVRPL